MAKGTYAIMLHLPDARRIQVGKLGEYLFPAGYYVYVGSALGGLEHRLGRHLRREKVLRWHVDYLREFAEVVGVWLAHGDERLECRWMFTVRELTGAQVLVPRFGSSDCRCPAHLAFFLESPELSALDAEKEPFSPACGSM